MQQRALVDNALTNRLQRSVGELRSVAWWDDALTNSSAEGFNKDWLDQEIGSYMNESYKHDRLVILDEKDRPVYAYGEGTGLGTTGLAQDLAAAKSIIAQARGGRDVSPRVHSTAKPGELYEYAQFNNRRYSRGFGAIIEVDKKPTIATATLITPSYDVSGTPPRRRIVITFIDVTPAVLSDIGGGVLMPDLAFAKAKGGKVALFDLKTDQGKYLAQLQWVPKRPGSEMTSRVLPYILGALLVAALLLVGLIRRLLSSTKSLELRENEAQHLANHDSLTGLPNRRHLEAELFKRASYAPHGQSRLACAVIDLDRFKDINDTLGHAAGDALIDAVAKRLSATLSKHDFVARLGGDEFAILRECKNLEDAETLSTLLISAFAEPFEVLGHQVETSASVGISVSSLDRALEDLMREADIALYEAKANYKGATVRFAPSMASKIEQRRALEVDLKVAIANRTLSMAYQPIVEAGSGIMTSVEALVRWNSTKHGAVPPDVFVAIAEETGLMSDLGRFVIDQSVADSKRWPGLATAINLSAAQLRSATIVQDLMGPVRKYGVSPSSITLEITESVLLANDQRTLRILGILKDHGFSIALDDFGTGYSSLAYVRDFPFDKLKIDRSFVKGQSENARSVDIIKAVVNFGRILGREVVAEGIETEQEMQAMQAAGVTHLQGYLFSKPVSAAHVEGLIAVSGRLSATRGAAESDAEPTRIDRSLAAKLRNIA